MNGVVVVVEVVEEALTLIAVLLEIQGLHLGAVALGIDMTIAVRH